jgi:FkbM family methyltransferase
LLEGVYQLDVVPFKPDVVLDLGANIGLFALLAAQRWPLANLVCVEPHPTTFSFLCDNLALNGVNAVKLQCAVDAEVGVKFLENEGAVYQTLSNRASGTPVMTLQLDSLIPGRNDLKLLIKMDIEGSEVAALDHLTARLPQNTFVFIELHRGDESLRWMKDWAELNAFRFSVVRRRDDAIDGYLTRDPAYVTTQGRAALSPARRTATNEFSAKIANDERRGEDTVAPSVSVHDSGVLAAQLNSSV